MKVTLRIQTPMKLIEQEMSMNSSIVLGRNETSDCVIDDAQTSGAHCRLTLKVDRLEIHDLQSKNGTYLNGIRVDRSEVFMGDEVKIGKTTITLAKDKMEDLSIDRLTFPGPFKDRIKHELKVDFTGARIQYQSNKDASNNHLTSRSTPSLKKKKQTNIQQDKKELRSHYKLKANIAFLVDSSIFILLLILSVSVISKNINSRGIEIADTQIGQPMFILGAVLAVSGLYYLLNIKILKFTIGEKLVGLERAYYQKTNS